MQTAFANRMLSTPKSFIREILKVTEDPRIISFAGGLPNPKSFPVKAVSDAAAHVLREHGIDALQYRTTEGYLPLRQFIARRYQERYGMAVDPANILITNGSQQALDLVGKVFLNVGDRVVLERPSYLGAIQALSIYEPTFHDVPLEADGIDLAHLDTTIADTGPKLMYIVANFQNPTGLSYSREKRQGLAELLRKTGTVLVEDDPYGELRFRGEMLPPVKYYLPEQTVLLGSFSKIVAPGMRLGWLCAPPAMMEKFVIAKQAADLHSSAFTQHVVSRYLHENDVDAHIASIREMYGRQRDLMLDTIARCCPPEVTTTHPEGGMFLWLTLPEGLSSMDLFNHAIEEQVAFVPGTPFYIGGRGDNTLRLNFSNSDETQIVEGITRLGRVLERLLSSSLPSCA